MPLLAPLVPVRRPEPAPRLGDDSAADVIRHSGDTSPKPRRNLAAIPKTIRLAMAALALGLKDYPDDPPRTALIRNLYATDSR
jgi:hypothetical protein